MLRRVLRSVAAGSQRPHRARCARLFSDDSHSDFQPKRKAAAPASPSAKEVIAKDIKEHAVFVYMKGRPSMPQCGFSGKVVQILNSYGATYGSRNVLEEPEIREGIKQFTNWPTIPQVFIKGEFVGGCDIVTSMHKEGELKQMLEDAGALGPAKP